MPQPYTIPVGAIVAYAGPLTDENITAIHSAGWLVCDGMSYSEADYPNLYQVIGHRNGGTESSFNVPDFRGRFARGRDADSGNDPDATSRVAANPGGDTGNNVGSLQYDASAIPKTSWTLSSVGNHMHTFTGLSTATHDVWWGSTEYFALSSEESPHMTDVSQSGAHDHQLTGGDEQTLPKKIALNWIIRAVPAALTGTTPAGTMIGFGAPATNPPVGWRYCNGQAVATSESPGLFAAIGCNYGGDGQAAFDLPDVRGRFLRGTDHNTQRDPDVQTRRPCQPGGNSGNAVGSLQDWATAMPRNPFITVEAGDHSHTCPNIPGTDHHAAMGATAKECMTWNAGPTQTTGDGAHTHSVLGGDKETRPENIYVDWLIAFADVADAPPIGSIVAVGIDVTNPANSQFLIDKGWLPCTGLSVTAATYSELFNVIGTTFGGNAVNFRAPDLRGLFVTGADPTDFGLTEFYSHTAEPTMPFVTTTSGGHSHGLAPIPTGPHTGDIAGGWDMAEWNSGTGGSSISGSHTHPITGGDAETRPVNLYVDYVIRYR